MNLELEKIVESLIANGDISNKSRELLKKKAEQLGIDLLDFELEIESKIAQLKDLNNNPLKIYKTQVISNKEKVGNIKTCPACGASVKYTELTCIDCGHEFTNVSANSLTKEIELKISEIERKASKMDEFDGDEYINNHIINLIKNIPIPTSKEDLFEMLSFMSSKVISSTEYGDELINAYQGRAIEIITKLRLISSTDINLMSQINLIESQMKKVKFKNARNLWLIAVFSIPLIYCFYSFIARLFGYHFWPF